jgi:hypothetical protein
MVFGNGSVVLVGVVAAFGMLGEEMVESWEVEGGKGGKRRGGGGGGEGRAISTDAQCKNKWS